MPEKLQALSLFSGAGGMDIGVKNAGFHVDARVELDKFALDQHRQVANSVPPPLAETMATAIRKYINEDNHTCDMLHPC